LGCDLKQLDETEAARHPLLSELVELKLKLRDADEGARSQLREEIADASEERLALAKKFRFVLNSY